MRPYPEEVLRALQTGVASHLAPELTSSYAQAQFAFAMVLFGVAQRDYDTAAQDLVDNNRALRELLTDADAALASISMPEASAAHQALAALAPAATSLRLSELRAEEEALRQAIGDMAALIEPAGDLPELAPLAPVRARMFAWFKADARRRVVPILSN